MTTNTAAIAATTNSTATTQEQLEEKLEKFYPPLPKQVQYGQYTFVEPNTCFKFPIFRCCPEHSAGTGTGTNCTKQQLSPWDEPAPPWEDDDIEKEGDDDIIEEMDMIQPEQEQDDFILNTPDNNNKQSQWSAGTSKNCTKQQPLSPWDDDNIIEEEMDFEAEQQAQNDFIFTEPEPDRRRQSNCSVVSSGIVFGPLTTTNCPIPASPWVKDDETIARDLEKDIFGPLTNTNCIIPASPWVNDPIAIEKDIKAIKAEQEDDFILHEPVNKQANWLSFMRPNVALDVVPKSAANFKKVMDSLRSIHPQGSGVVFCMSKFECEQVVENIGLTVNALPFHGDLTAANRKSYQQRWEKNEVQILCATIAFGKGILKPDVRFVVHFTMPQSLHLYEQQCGLAGLDGKKAHCVLLYNFNDHLRVWRLIRTDVPKPPANELKRKEEQLRDVMRYAENVATCRRQMLAEYFGEKKYTSDRCRMQPEPCTLCALLAEGRPPLQRQDFTDKAVAIFQSIGEIENAGVQYVADLFRGQMTKKKSNKRYAVDETNHGRLPLFGLGHGLLDHDAIRFIHNLVIEEYLKLRMVQTRHNTVIGYVELAKRGHDFKNKYQHKVQSVPGNERIYLHIAEPKPKDRRRSSKGSQLDGTAGALGGDIAAFFENSAASTSSASRSNSFIGGKRMRF